MDAWTAQASPFHEGEKELQTRAGVREEMEAFARRVVRPYLPAQHREFYSQLPFVAVGSVDPSGAPWASLLAGRPGFLSSSDEKRLTVGARPLCSDPLRESLRVGAPVGMLGLDFATRRRNRVNGRIVATGESAFEVGVDQAFGNCPQYIQTRAVEFSRNPDERVLIDCAPLSGLDAEARAMMGAADTFFVASYAPTTSDPSVEGVDVSHRGGRPGFVKVDGDTLTIPDFTGNFHFNTLGNFLINPKAGVTFVDFATGDLLMLTGRTEMIWDGPEVESFRGAERAWRFVVTSGRRLRNALPIRWTFEEFSPNTLITGDWVEAATTAAAEAKRNAWRPHRVVRIEDESDVIRSFYLEPEDGDGLAKFEAGQFLTIRVKLAGCEDYVTRTYTVSSAPHDKLYRVSVKKESAPSDEFPPGLASTYLHEDTKPGDLIEAKAPRGAFTIDAGEHRPAVLIAGGVGVTPMMSMLRHLVHEGLRTRHTREAVMIHAAQTTTQRAFYEEAMNLSNASRGAIRYLSLISRPAEGETPGTDFHGVGYIDAEFLRRTLPLDDYDFYLCGPPGFMQAVYDALGGLGVRDARIFAEAFGPASLTRRADAGATQEDAVAAPPADEALVSFASSKFEQRWTKEAGTLLEFAEAHGLTPEYGCRNGVCGTCATKVRKGAVTYASPPSASISDGEALICCATPAAGSDELELDL